VISLNITD